MMSLELLAWLVLVGVPAAATALLTNTFAAGLVFVSVESWSVALCAVWVKINVGTWVASSAYSSNDSSHRLCIHLSHGLCIHLSHGLLIAARGRHILHLGLLIGAWGWHVLLLLSWVTLGHGISLGLRVLLLLWVSSATGRGAIQMKLKMLMRRNVITNRVLVLAFYKNINLWLYNLYLISSYQSIKKMNK